MYGKCDWKVKKYRLKENSVLTGDRKMITWGKTAVYSGRCIVCQFITVNQERLEGGFV